MRLNHNMQSLDVLRNYRNHLVNNSSALEKITTGSKINSAKDNPVKIGQSETLRMQIRGLQAAQRNLQDGVSMTQTADQALSTIGDVVNKMKELAVQAANGSYTDDDRAIVQEEMEQLKTYIDETARNTEFNGQKLIGNENVTDNEYPEYKNMQSGAMVKEDIKIPYFNVSTNVLKDKDGNSLKDVDVTNSDNINSAIEVIDNALTIVNSCRAKFGALEQRMETAATNMDKNLMSLEKAESNVADADLALEMMEFSRTTILKDTSTALLQQTNNFPKDILTILQNMK